MKVLEKGRVVINTAVAENLYYMQIELPEIASRAKPGNFITLLPPADSERYLRRPFSIALSEGSCLGLVVKEAGAVTQAFSRLVPGSPVEALGPLGNSYPPEILGGNGRVWMIGGGTGIASLLFLSSARNKISNSKSRDRLLWAGRKASALPCSDPGMFDRSVYFATDDGSFGECGTGAGVLQRWLEKGEPDAVIACGPCGMIREIRKTVLENSIPAWFSLEEFMACGTGACSGCVCRADNSIPGSGKSMYFNVCSDGPVFSAGDVML